VGRSIGLDVHRDFCQVAIADGGRARSAGRVAATPEQLELFAQSLAPTDRVVLEATGNALAIARILAPHVAEVVLAHAKQVRAISHARVKTDKVDARVLADLLAAGLIPAVWIGDERVRTLRRLVSRRRGLVKRRTQVKNEIAAALHRNLRGRPPVSDPFGKKGRAWIAAQELQEPRAAARVRPAHRGEAGTPRRNGRRRAQARRARLAPAHARRGLRLRAPQPRPAQDSPPRAHLRRAPGQARPQARPGLERNRRRRRETPRGAGRGRLPPPHRRLASQRPESGCGRDTGARICKALEGQGRAAGHKLLTPALRHVSHPHPRQASHKESERARQFDFHP
jgi:Transposase